MKAYQQSKLANLMLALELDRRLRSESSPVMSIAVHPGVANTNLFKSDDHSPVQKTLRNVAAHAIDILLNTDAEGALPTLFAATSAGCGRVTGNSCAQRSAGQWTPTRRWTESCTSCFRCWRETRAHHENIAGIRRSLLDVRPAVERERRLRGLSGAHRV